MDELVYNKVKNVDGIIRQAIAGEAFAAGDVAYVDNGTAYHNENYDPSYDEYYTSGSSYCPPVFQQLDTTHFLMVYSIGSSSNTGSLQCAIVTVKDHAVTGTSASCVIMSGVSGYYQSINMFQITANTYLVVFTPGGSSAYASVVIVSSVTSISASSFVGISTSGGNFTSVCQLSSSTYVAHFGISSQNGAGFVTPFLVSGTTITMGTCLQWTSNSGTGGIVYPIDATHCLVCGENYNSSSTCYLYASVLTLTGLVLSASGQLQVAVTTLFSTTMNACSIYKVTSSTFLVAFSTNNALTCSVILSITGAFTITLGTLTSTPWGFTTNYPPAIQYCVSLSQFVLQYREQGELCALKVSGTVITYVSYGYIPASISQNILSPYNSTQYVIFSFVSGSAYLQIVTLTTSSMVTTTLNVNLSSAKSYSYSSIILIDASHILVGVYNSYTLEVMILVYTDNKIQEGYTKNFGVVLNAVSAGGTLNLLCKGISKGVLSGLKQGSYYINRQGTLAENVNTDTQIVSSSTSLGSWASLSEDIEALKVRSYAVALDTDELLILEPFNRRGCL